MRSGAGDLGRFRGSTRFLVAIEQRRLPAARRAERRHGATLQRAARRAGISACVQPAFGSGMRGWTAAAAGAVRCVLSGIRRVLELEAYA